jgi:serine/threonine-protein kinase
MLRDTPAVTPFASLGRTSVPPEVLLSGVKRLRLLAIVLMGIFATAGLVTLYLRLFHVARPAWLDDTALSMFVHKMRGLQFCGFALGVAMIVITKWKRLAPERILTIGLVFQVLGAVLFSGTDFAVAWSPDQGPAGLPRATIWIMAFPLVPSTVRRSTLAAFAAAMTGPVAYLGAMAYGQPVPAPATAVLFYIPLFIAAIVSSLVSKVIHGLAVDVSKARRLGSYSLVEKLAQGGMGEIWRARHGSLIRPAAVKLIRPELLGEKSTGEMGAILRRFEREAQATSLLVSPHTVVLYDFGRTDDGIIYYVMELLGGVDLETLVRRFGPLPAERVVYILDQVCHALADAHRVNLVHRDIKPANIQLTVHGADYDFVKVFDFGLVKRQGQELGPLTSGDQVITGTPAYLSPEAATRGGGTVDGQSDLYALGAVAYWLLTGQLVFQADNAMSMIVAHVKELPQAPSRRTELPIPPELDALVLDLLAKDPAARPAGAAEVARRLAAIPLADPWTRERAERWWRAHLPQEISTQICQASEDVG